MLLRHRTLTVALCLVVQGLTGWATGTAVSQTPRLVRDLGTDAPPSPPFSSPRSFTELGDLVLFSASDPANGFELWASDGTEAGTRLIADLCPGACDSDFTPLWSTSTRLVFTAVEGLWSTDGTSEGTVQLPGLVPFFEPTTDVLGELTGPPRLVYTGPGGDPASESDRALWVTDGAPERTRAFFDQGRVSIKPLPGVSLGDSLLFVHDTPGIGAELWITDGTEPGTGLLLDILPGSGSSRPSKFANLGPDLALFAASDPTAGEELWRSDGTVAGTRRVADLTPGPGGSNILFPPISDGDKAFFLAELLPSTAGSLQLWVTDGTEVGTRALTAFTGPEPFGDRHDLIGGDGTRAERFQVIGSRLYFVADDGSGGLELWTSDGTLLGTRRVVDLCPGTCSSDPRLLLGQVSGTVLLTADDGSGRQPWISDGTAGGTRPLVTSCSGPCPGSAYGLLSDGQRAFFVAFDDPGFQRQLWVTDGTSSGTERLTDFDPGALGLQGDDDAAMARDGLLFSASDPERGTEPWVSDGSAAGTGPLADLATQETLGSDPVPLATAGTHAYFATEHPSGLPTLWVTDGSSAGTRPASDLVPGGGTVSLVTTIGLRSLLFSDGRLWGSDGTPTGTYTLADLRSAGSTAPRSARAAYEELEAGGTIERTAGHLEGRLVFFLGDDLWVSDATSGGTRPIAHLRPVQGRAVGPFFASLGSRVLFVAEREEPGSLPGLWITDGTEAGTQLVFSGDGDEDFVPQQLTTAGGRVLFGSGDRLGGYELWSTDGTAQGTGRLDTPLTRPRDLTAVGARAFFTARSSLVGPRELWVSDGTAAGTRIVDPLSRAGASRILRESVSFGGRFVFVPDDAAFGHELWVSDGTAEGTRLLIDLWPGRAGSEPEHLVPMGDRLVFTASTPERGRELWMTDGTAAGTVPLFDLIPGPGSSDPSRTLLVRGTLLFGATDGVRGRELWALDLAGGAPPAEDDPPPPPGPWLSGSSLPGFRVKVRITPPAGSPLPGSREPACIPETLCVSGAVPGRSEVFVRVVGPRLNGRLWPILVKFTTSQVEVWIEQLSSGEVEYYLLQGARPGFDELPGLFDREGFSP